jgi:hypothetical protein
MKARKHFKELAKARARAVAEGLGDWEDDGMDDDEDEVA